MASEQPTLSAQESNGSASNSALLLRDGEEVATTQESIVGNLRSLDRFDKHVQHQVDFDSKQTAINDTFQPFFTSRFDSDSAHSVSPDHVQCMSLGMHESSCIQDKIDFNSNGLNEVDGASVSALQPSSQTFYVLFRDHSSPPQVLSHWQVTVDRQADAHLILGPGQVLGVGDSIKKACLFYFRHVFPPVLGRTSCGYLTGLNDAYYVVLDISTLTLKMVESKLNDDTGCVYMQKDSNGKAFFYYMYKNNYYLISPDTKNMTVVVTRVPTKPDFSYARWAVNYT